ncbi:MAG: hypothetical protein ACI4K9_05300 [Candidatus Fimenecus sp.]
MKLVYRKPLIFPTWGIFNGKDAGKSYYRLEDDCVVFTPEKEKLPHHNHIEMTGFEASSIVSYKVDEKKRLKLYTFCVFPQIRVIPNLTRGGLTRHYRNAELQIKSCKTEVTEIRFDGILQIREQAGSVEICHRMTAARTKKAFLEEITLKNIGTATQTFTLKTEKLQSTVKKIYMATDADQPLYTAAFDGETRLTNAKTVLTLPAGQEKVITVCYGAEKLTLKDVKAELDLRAQFIADSKARFKIQTPNETVNRMLDFCKIRASESIFNTKNGLMHAPGGGNFYGALWTNDQCEYANPLFAYLGYKTAQEQSLNCYRLYADLAKPDKAIPTSIIACGDGVWHGAGDRGDSSMFLYGLCRFLLSTGDREKAMEFLPSIETAATYVKSQITVDGIVKSDSDELENRFESGKANLSTAVITYDAFLSLQYFYKELGEAEKAEQYRALAEKIEKGIENYFGANVEGFETYRYCEEEPHLRSWICLPLTVGIDKRKDGTVQALLSDKLSKDSGILTKSGTKTYWDRAALYGMRGLFYVGESEKAFNMLTAYTKERMLGCHPPYPVEAFPEGNSAQLSAESALYLRIFTEGILGYRPTGFDSFQIKPNLPNAWDSFQIQGMELCGKTVDIAVQNGENYTVKIGDDTVTVPKGEAYIYTFSA